MLDLLGEKIPQKRRFMFTQVTHAMKERGMRMLWNMMSDYRSRPEKLNKPDALGYSLAHRLIQALTGQAQNILQHCQSIT